ncbi:Hypothetical protein PACV_63 [Pacmanvirus A23]|uniref:Hypothetical protein n=1 Tax=Pacmanvirus A23 TaxID=1932881 RepID=UPI000A09399C|nr:Hypothetical protein B9W72_gp063 [Pacmanvirus A23]SIP85780.1 Hypothetical protein PACV_63 [Pacmanvirus A23]
MEFEDNYRRLKQELDEGPAEGNILFYAPSQLTERIAELDDQIAALNKERNHLELRYRLISRINAKNIA